MHTRFKNYHRNARWRCTHRTHEHMHVVSCQRRNYMQFSNCKCEKHAKVLRIGSVQHKNTSENISLKIKFGKCKSDETTRGNTTWKIDSWNTNQKLKCEIQNWTYELTIYKSGRTHRNKQIGKPKKENTTRGIQIGNTSREIQIGKYISYNTIRDIQIVKL